MKVKVCGMKDPKNIKDLLAQAPDMMGLIFYQKSKRYVGDIFPNPFLKADFPSIEKVGVFVNHSIDFIFSQVKRYELDYIQLHGDESADFCAHIKSPILRGARQIPNTCKTIKAFAVDADFDFQSLAPYLPEVDYFLFDTKGKNYGGNGIAFDWEILNDYPYDLPFLLSGGIGPDNLDHLIEFLEKNELPVFAIDVNSKFELSPGFKDISQVEEMLQKVKPRRATSS
ncbi:MAG: phosphoribosylanthranilate isomerase [Bacteroidota bacterium]